MKRTFSFILACLSLLSVSCTSNSVTDESVPEVVIPEPVPAVVKSNLVTEVGFMWTFATESSGVVLSDGFIYTHNDSGNSSVFFKVNPTDGTLIQTIKVTNFSNVDWEDITADDDFIYIGDFGNNDGIRKDLKVLKISKSQFKNATDAVVYVTAEAIQFSYTEQTSFITTSTHNFDCETVISKGDSLYIFTKDRGDNATRVYKLSKTPGEYALTAIGGYNVKGLVTGGDYNAQTNEVVLIGYSASGHKNSFIYLLSNFTADSFFSGKVVEKIIGNSTNDWQTEGITFGSADGKKLFLSCETTAFTKSELYTTDKTTLGF
ncbi:hypothetical protein [Flavobacterium cellulosilyticum]|uniref:T9SS C-terminal target domain-containing protein n=1 Tax=Flavobacterium cellulosilyticum TaxID=2541731 RepID=A0A4R5CKN8_9FLAO|nr:hypothetical protein [Flavobacterium cellulosilyticum]TDD99749.1 hypothetical protein E0F76_03240 [Flavobacterium cellulosilyticum]